MAAAAKVQCSEQRYTFKIPTVFIQGDTGLNLYLHAYGRNGSPYRANFHDDMFLWFRL